jgi:hypothetical protein
MEYSWSGERKRRRHGLNSAVAFIPKPVFLVGRTEVWKKVVLTGLLQFGTNALDFFLIVFRRVRFVQNVILLVLQKYASEAVLEIFTKCAEFTVTAIRAVEAEVAGVGGRTVDALIRPFTFKTM